MRFKTINNRGYVDSLDLLVAVIFLVFIVSMICMCGNAQKANNHYTAIEKDLVFDNDTHIIYIRSTGGQPHSYCPYYSESGKLCQYIDGEIRELSNENQDP